MSQRQQTASVHPQSDHPIFFSRFDDQSAFDGALGFAASPARRSSTASFSSDTGGDSPRLANAANITIITANTTKHVAMEVNVSSVSPLTDASSPRSDSSPWVGGTGLGSAGLGKSGRVIERLMAENDRLRREMKAEMTKMEEMQRTVATMKPKLESLQSDNARLAHTKSMDDNIISRRDRKIDELKADLEAERRKRHAAESRAADYEQQRDMALDANRHELQQEREKARHATVHADILQTSHQQLSREYRQRIATTTKSLKDLVHDRDGDRRRLARLDVVCNQMRQETERMRGLHVDLVSTWQRFESARNADVQRLQHSATKALSQVETKAADNEALGEEMKRVLAKMNWAVRMEGTFGREGPPVTPRVGSPGQGRRVAVV